MLDMEFRILYWLQELRSPVLDQAMEAITHLGDKGWFFILLGAALFFIPRTRRAGTAVLLSLLCGMIVGNLCLKNLVMRPRPCWIDASVPLLIPVPHDYSFPSGHTLAAFETAVSIFLVNRKWGTAFLIFAALIGLSRMYLFVHFPTDVLSGAALGIFIAWFVKKGVEKYRLCDILRVQKNKKAE